VRWVLPAGEIPHLTLALSAPKGGEGDIELLAFCFQHARQILHHIPVPEPDHTIASPGDFPAPQLIRADCARVLPTIELNHAVGRWARKSDDVSADRVLPTKPV